MRINVRLIFGKLVAIFSDFWQSLSSFLRFLVDRSADFWQNWRKWGLGLSSPKLPKEVDSYQFSVDSRIPKISGFCGKSHTPSDGNSSLGKVKLVENTISF